MNISIVLIGLGLLIFFAHIFSATFSKTRIPSVLLLMLIGLVIGPITGLLTPDDMGQAGSIFTTITLICILFQSGTSLELKTLGKSIGPASLITTVNFIVMMGIGLLLGLVMLKLSVIQSCFLGAALGGTSSAVVIPMVNQLKPCDKASTILSLESALSDIICLIVAMSLFESFDSGSVDTAKILKQILLTMLFSYTIGVVVGYLWILALKQWLKKMDNSMSTTFALAFIVYGITDLIGLNGGMAILAFGISVANFHMSPLVRRSIAERAENFTLNENDRNFYAEIVFILQTYFFVYIGMSIRFNNLYHILVGFIFVLLAFGSRFITMAILGKKDYSVRDRRLLRILGPKGLVAAVLASLPLQWAQNIHAAPEMIEACQTIQDVAYAVVLISIILCSILVIVTENKHEEGKQAETVPATAAADDTDAAQAETAAEAPGELQDQNDEYPDDLD